MDAEFFFGSQKNHFTSLDHCSDDRGHPFRHGKGERPHNHRQNARAPPDVWELVSIATLGERSNPSLVICHKNGLLLAIGLSV
jgi:hypothetical protein